MNYNNIHLRACGGLLCSAVLCWPAGSSGRTIYSRSGLAVPDCAAGQGIYLVGRPPQSQRGAAAWSSCTVSSYTVSSCTVSSCTVSSCTAAHPAPHWIPVTHNVVSAITRCLLCQYGEAAGWHKWPLLDRAGLAAQSAVSQSSGWPQAASPVVVSRIVTTSGHTASRTVRQATSQPFSDSPTGYTQLFSSSARVIYVRLLHDLKWGFKKRFCQKISFSLWNLIEREYSDKPDNFAGVSIL